MEEIIKYMGSLVGRVFLISQQSNIVNWHGTKEKPNGGSDYFDLEDYIIFEENNISQFVKSTGEMYYIYFSMSSKIEIFVKEKGLIILEGLYFNENLGDFFQKSIEYIGNVDFKINFENEYILVFDASLNGDEIIPGNEGIFNLNNNKFNSYAVLSVPKGIYNVKKVILKLSNKLQDIELKGIEINL